MREEGRTACVLLEAAEGMGKSRLLAEVARRLERPESLLRSAALPTGSVGHPDLDGLLAPDPRKRPLLLLVDGCEHLTFPAILHLAGLLRIPRSSGCLALLAGRPSLLALRGCLDPWLEERAELPPLDEVELRQVWKGMFGHETSPAVAQALVEACSGNPAVIRRVLGELLEAGWVQADATGQSRLTPTEVREVADQWVDVLCQARLGSLTPRLRRLAVRLGVLGPVLSREAARLLLGAEADELLDDLELAGLTGPPRRPHLRLAGPPSRETLVAWTDDVVAHWLEQARGPLPAVALALLDGSVPLYALTPYLRLELGLDEPVAGSLLLPLLTTSEKVLLAQQRQPDPTAGHRVAQALWNLLERQQGWRSDPELCAAAGRLLAAHLFLMGRQAGGHEFRRIVDSLLELTQDSSDPRLLDLRLLTLIQLNRHHLRQESGDASGTRREIAQLVGDHPRLRRHRFYRVFLGDMGLMAWGRGQHATLDWVEAQLEELLATEEDTEERAQARQRIGVTLLSHFQDSAGAESRQRLAQELSTLIPGSDAVFPALRLHLLLQDGRLEEFLMLWAGAHDLWHSRGLTRNLAVGESWLRAVLALGGEDPARLTSNQGAANRDALGDLPLLEVALLLGHDTWAGRRLEGLQVSNDADRAARRLQFHWAWGQPGRTRSLRALRSLEPHGEDPPRLRELATLLTPGSAWTTASEARAAALLSMPVARLDHLLILQTLAGQAAGRPALRPVVAAALEAALDWCSRRQLGLVVRAWLRRFSSLFPAPRRRAWLRRAEGARFWGEGAPERHGSAGIRLRVLGPMTLALPGRKPRRVRGARQRWLLAALTLAPLLRVPLPRREFRALATGLEPDESVGRVRNLLALSVHRLRLQLGDEAFLAGGGELRLNPAVVGVDLHATVHELDEADRLLTLDQAAGAARHVGNALSAMESGLPFADCFHPLFDALREDLVARSRRLSLETARRLAPAPEARGLLEALFHLDNGDGEVAEELALALEREQMGAEARVVRGRARAAGSA